MSVSGCRAGAINMPVKKRVHPASEAPRGLLDVFMAICYCPINTSEGAQTASAQKGVKTGYGIGWPKLCGVQRIIFLHSHLWQRLPSYLEGL